MANNFVSFYSHSSYTTSLVFISYHQLKSITINTFHKILSMYHFSLTLHVFSLVDNRAEIEHCLI